MQELSGFKQSKPVIAIDGTAASGKGTLAKNLAKKINFDHLDTGILYRYLAYIKKTKNFSSIEDIKNYFFENYSFENLDKKKLRNEEISKISSHLAAKKEVRSFLLNFQRKFANNPPSRKGSVIDGRDIGTTVIPSADIKLYVDADLKIRADRRFKELLNNQASKEEVLKALKKRDFNDKNRKESPLVMAKDSILIDTSQLSPNQCLDRALVIVKNVIKNITN